MDRILEEPCGEWNGFYHRIYKWDALAEGGYTENEFEKVFRELNPKWDSRSSRWVFEYHVIEVSK